MKDLKFTHRPLGGSAQAESFCETFLVQLLYFFSQYQIIMNNALTDVVRLFLDYEIALAVLKVFQLNVNTWRKVRGVCSGSVYAALTLNQ